MRTIFTISENIDERKFSFNYIVCFSLLGGNAAFLLAFLWLGFKVLAIFSFAGTITYLICFLLIKYKHIRAAILLAVFELFTIVWFQIHYLGWSSGFQFYILCIMPVLFLSEFLTMIMKIIMAFLCIVYYIFILPIPTKLIPIMPYPYDITNVFGMINILIVFVGLSIIMHYYYSLVLNSETKLKEANTCLELLTETDALTGAYNRRHMMRVIENEIALFKRKQLPFLIAMVDVDNFKLINDTYGHDCGDQVLKEIVRRICEVIRQNDIVARWGGEEFLFLLPETNLSNGLHVMDRIRGIIADSPMNCDQGSFYVTITIGLALYKDKYDLKDIVKIADENLYRGKKSGKNCIIADDPT